MKHLQKILFASAALFSAAQVVAAACPTNTNFCGTPFLAFRSTHVNTVRDIVGIENLVNLCDQDCNWYGVASLALEFDQTFRGDRIARCLFGSDVSCGNSCVTSSSTTSVCNTACGTDCGDNNGCGRNNCASLAISGSRAATRGANDWLADYFGLPADFQSTITFCPRIRNFTADISFYFGLDNWAEGLYFRLALPITNTRWSLRACENVTVAGDADVGFYPAGYFAPSIVPTADLLTNALSFFSGSVPTLPDGVVFQPLAYSRFGGLNGTNCGGCDGLRLTRLAAVAAELGWNFVCCDDYHFGLKLRATAPTGNRPCGGYLFEPIVGNGHFWEFGAGISAHANLWRCDESDSAFNLYFEGNVVHLFRTCQTRTFDLCGKPNSRYMLAQRLEAADATVGLGSTPTEEDLAPGDVTLAEFQFADEFAPVANLTTRQVNVSVAAQGDFSVKFAWETGCGFEWDLGYNFWGRSCEKFCNRTNCSPSLLTSQTWALKGDASVYGFLEDDTTPVALVATESGANIHAGCNGFVAGDPASADNIAAFRNPGIDNAAFAVTLVGTTVTPVDALEDSTVTQTRISDPAVPLTDCDINFSGTKGISNKVFTHLNYEWKDCECWTPFLGIGASAEFGQNNCCNTNCNTNCGTNSTSTACNTNCNTDCGSNRNGNCQSCAISQWGVWIKGGVAFN